MQFLRGPDDVYSKHDIKILIRIISSRMSTAAIPTLQGQVFRESEAPKLWNKFTLGYKRHELNMTRCGLGGHFCDCCLFAVFHLRISGTILTFGCKVII